MARNEITLGATGAAQGRVVFLNGKLRMQYGTAPAWTDYITVDSAGLITLPTATAAASGLKIGTAVAIYDASGTLTLKTVNIADATNEASGLKINGSTSTLFAASRTLTWGNSGIFNVATLGGESGLLDITTTISISGNANNGQRTNIKHLTELTTIAAAATTDTAIQIPINAVVFAVSVRVTVVIPTAATFTVTGTTSGTTFNTAAVDVAADTTNVGTAACPYKNGAAQTIRITPSATPADNTGRVRVTIHYYDITAATS